MYVEIWWDPPKNATRKNKFTKVSGYKINLLCLYIFLNVSINYISITNFEQSKGEF